MDSDFPIDSPDSLSEKKGMEYMERIERIYYFSHLSFFGRDLWANKVADTKTVYE